MTVFTLDRPVDFPGTEEEAAANRATHSFDEEGRCYRCDGRPWGRVARYPCGQEPPRETVTLDHPPTWKETFG